MKTLILWDLDNTLACHRHRDHLTPLVEQYGDVRAWDAFNMAWGDDLVIADVVALYKLLSMATAKAPQYRHVMITSRVELADRITMVWLADNGIRMDQVFMRPADEAAPPRAFKQQLIEQRLGAGNILVAIDDDPANAEMMAALGITVLQVHRGREAA